MEQDSTSGTAPPVEPNAPTTDKQPITSAAADSNKETSAAPSATDTKPAEVPAEVPAQDQAVVQNQPAVDKGTAPTAPKEVQKPDEPMDQSHGESRKRAAPDDAEDKNRTPVRPHIDATPDSTVRRADDLSPPAKKAKYRVNQPWTPAEEQRLKILRDAGNSWSQIAKDFPNRTEGSVKKHWYKDMHYAEFAEDESAALLAAIKEYENNKWKAIGQKLGKPAKACEQYAREHFSAEQIRSKDVARPATQEGGSSSTANAA